MQVILEKTVPKLGLLGEVVSVKNGYARNFLFPKKMALLSSEHNRASVAKRVKTVRASELKQQDEAKALAKILEGVSVTIAVKANEEGKLFGSISAVEVVAAIKKDKGLELDKSVVEFREHIKQLGVYTVALKLHALVHQDVKVWVVREAAA
jgi:large subunit ribosomal protein L9